MINIIGGIKKRTKIEVPKYNVRPTSAQKRESIFSIIESYGKKNNFNIYEKINVLDLFAGSGALGLEAISRGAFFGYFIDNDFDSIRCLKNNCQKICKISNYKIINENILETNFNKIKKKISMVFIDPPYNINPFADVLLKLNSSKILSKNFIIILEYSENLKIQIPPFFSMLIEKKYRKTRLSFLIKN